MAFTWVSLQQDWNAVVCDSQSEIQEKCQDTCRDKRWQGIFKNKSRFHPKTNTAQIHAKQCQPLILLDKKHNANDRGEQKPEPLLRCMMHREHLQHFRIPLQVDYELLFHEVLYYFLYQPLLLLFYVFPVLSLAEVAIYPHTDNTHRGTKALQQARMLFPLIVYKRSLLFTLALQSSLPSPFVIITSDMLADAIGFKDPVPQVVCVQFINLFWIILIY